NSDGESLSEIVISGVVDIAKDRKTPVAVSTIRAVEIQDKLGSQEFPELLNSTPSVYATKQGGGFGDARINIRGFSQENIAVMINGMPVNDMENGKVYWSNWAGLSDVTTAMQVQRGLGSSKLAISSVGGTVNIITNTANKKQGGAVRVGMGNDGYQKYLATYSTGQLESGLSASILLSRTTGDGYIDGTQFQGHNYFIGLGYKVNDNNKLMFTFTGAPQWHNQHYRAVSISNYQQYGSANEPNRKYNEQWGYLNGEVYTWRRNFYHKPIMSLNWDLDLSDNSKLSTVVYASWGRGGGSGPIGKYSYYKNADDALASENKQYYESYRLPRTNDGLVDFDFISQFNSGQVNIDFNHFDSNGNPQSSFSNTPDADGNFISGRKNAGFSRRASMNSHDWYGVVANYHNDLSENLNFDFGVDGRIYKGMHYRVANDLLGADGYTDNRDRNNPNRNITDLIEVSPAINPWADISKQQKIEYHNEGGVRWLGAFGQLEYSKDKLAAFVQFGVSSQAFQRTDYFNLPRDVDGDLTDEPQTSDWESLMGYNVKGGLNYNLTDKHNVFANAGYYEKQPSFGAVYPNYTDNNINEDLTNEKVLGIELGYGYKTKNYRLNANIYRTSWSDRFLRSSSKFDTTGDGDGDTYGVADLSGVEQIHTGIELEGSMKFGKLKLNGMLSVGDWKYNKNVTANFVDENNDPIILFGETNAIDKTLYLEDKKVGDAAQVTAFIGLNYEVAKGLHFDISQRYADKLYAQIDASAFTSEDTESLQLPGYSLIDTGVSYKYIFKDNKKSAKLRLNVNNLTDRLYIAESDTNYQVGRYGQTSTYNGVNVDNRVFWGVGRTWNATLSFNF
ncbi:MAG TPA: TonB-dependent receptor, partial [Crocinitomix sp.]|nr:TonB-dependent receptor [Crocinitomix sp.]